MFAILPCEDPELSLSERVVDGTWAGATALLQLALAVFLIPVWIVGAVGVGLIFLLNETDCGKRVGQKMGKRLAALWLWFSRMLTLPSDPEALRSARAALDENKPAALSQALMRRGFMGLRAVRPRDKVILLKSSLTNVKLSFDLCDAIVDSGCRVCGFWPDYDALAWAIDYKKDIAKIRWALSRGALPRANRNEWGLSLIKAVIDRQRVDILEAFEEWCPLDEGAKRRALRLAADDGADAMLKWMLARPDWQHAASHELTCRRRLTLLMRAAWHFESMSALLPLSRANQASYADAPALIRLIHGRLFMRVGAGSRALSRESDGSKLEVLDALSKAGVDLKGLRWGGSTLLHKAAARSNEGALNWLLALGLDPLARDGDGETPLMWAARSHSEACVRALVDVSAIDAINKKGQSALMIMAGSRVSNDEDQKAKMMGCGNVLIEAGSDPQRRDKKGLRAVDLAAKMANADVFEMLSPRSSWNYEAIEKALGTRSVRAMKRPKDVKLISGAVARSREACSIAKAVQVPLAFPAERSRRL